jgi:hypothetical protein
MQFQGLNAEKFRPTGDYGHLKARTLRVKSLCKIIPKHLQLITSGINVSVNE